MISIKQDLKILEYLRTGHHEDDHIKDLTEEMIANELEHYYEQASENLYVSLIEEVRHNIKDHQLSGEDVDQFNDIYH